jgi:hypothetical protein
MLSHLYYKLTSPVRPLPDFLVVGAQKSGTTSLFHYIQQHPQVLENRSKEIHFFDKYFYEGVAWYRSHFPIYAKIGTKSLVGEATPYYLCHPHSPRRIHELLPDVRMIAVLRNPAERAISHYFHEVKKGREKLSILEALHREEERCGSEWRKMLEDEWYVSRIHQSYSYKQRGVYIEQLQRFWEFFPRRQILVIDSSRLFAEPHAVLKEVFAFLGVDLDVVIRDVAVKNANPIKKDVPVDVYDYLNRYFAPYNSALGKALGLNFDW